MRKRDNKNGFILLGFLIVIAIIAILYMVNLRGLLGPDMDSRSPYEERPWFEEQRLIRQGSFPVEQTTKGGKTVIEKKTVFTGDVKRKDEQRGDIEIIIDPNGKAIGQWRCEYQYTKSIYTITAEFIGNIDPTKIYQDQTGKNNQLLYFITKGKYRQIKTDTGTGSQWPSEEIIYVIGWVDNNYSAQGKLFLMADNDDESNGNAEYDWKTKNDECPVEAIEVE